MDPLKAPANTVYNYGVSWRTSPNLRGFALPAIEPRLPKPPPITIDANLPKRFPPRR